MIVSATLAMNALTPSATVVVSVPPALLRGSSSSIAPYPTVSTMAPTMIFSRFVIPHTDVKCLLCRPDRSPSGGSLAGQPEL